MANTFGEAIHLHFSFLSRGLGSARTLEPQVKHAAKVRANGRRHPLRRSCAHAETRGIHRVKTQRPIAREGYLSSVNLLVLDFVVNRSRIICCIHLQKRKTNRFSESNVTKFLAYYRCSLNIAPT